MALTFWALRASTFAPLLVVLFLMGLQTTLFNPAKYGESSPEPVVEITFPSFRDQSLAPTGKHVLSAIVQFAPYQLQAGWEEGKGKFLRLALDQLEHYAPGIAGVTVSLLDNAGNVIATTTTDENGNYSFDDLPAGTYTVWVNDTDNVLGELTPTYDSDGGTLGITAVALSSATPIDLDQDFGYRNTSSPNTIGGTLWTDTDADGSLDAGETDRFSDVTIVLWDSSGNIVGTTTTDGSGDYSFTNLPDGTYTVDVSDDGNV